MQITRIRLVNFRQHEDTELALGAGLTGIIGPNGAGKTTMLEGIAYALYGAPAARGGKDSIRRRRSQPRSPVRVEVDFSLGAHHYQVTRSLSTAELHQDGDPSPVAVTLGAVTERLTRLLGMTRDEFFSTYFTGQKELAVMTSLSGPERAQFLSRVLGYERLKVAQQRLRERRNVLKSRLQALESSLLDTSELEAEESQVQARLEAARAQEEEGARILAAAAARREGQRPGLEEMERLKRSATGLGVDLKMADQKVSQARERFGQLDRQLAEAIGARDRVEPLLHQLAPLPALKAEVAGLDEREKAVVARQGYEAQLGDLRARLVRVEAELAGIPGPKEIDQVARDLEEFHAARSAQQADADQLRTVWVRDVQDARTKRQTLLDQYNDVKEQLERIRGAGPQGVCPTCTRPLGDEFDRVIGVLERQLEEIRFNGSFYRQRIEQLAHEPAEVLQAERGVRQIDGELQALTDRLAQLRAAAREESALREERGQLAARVGALEESLHASALPYDRARHEEVRGLLVMLQQVEIDAASLRVVADRARTLVRDAEVAERTLTEHENHVRELKDRIAALEYREEAHAALLEAAAAADRTRHEAEVALARIRAESRGAAEALATLARRREERTQREREARRVSADLGMHDEVDRALTDLRTDLNATLRPDLSDNASGFLRDMTGGRYSELELNEDYMPTIIEEGESKPVISGGEEDLANLALRLAISQMIAERAGQPLSLLVLDEIFGSLDEERRASVLELLRGLADRFPQVILITHIDTVREGFDRVIRVDFDRSRGSAVVHEETGGNSDGLAA